MPRHVYTMEACAGEIIHADEKVSFDGEYAVCWSPGKTLIGKALTHAEFGEPIRILISEEYFTTSPLVPDFSTCAQASCTVSSAPLCNLATECRRRFAPSPAPRPRGGEGQGEEVPRILDRCSRVRHCPRDR